MSGKLVYIGTIWPEPESSAAGIRTIGLLRAFSDGGWKVSFLGPRPGSLSHPGLEEVPSFEIAPNEPEFDRLIRSLSPDVVVFDRFYIEEQYGWRVETVCPEAVRVLDTVELHGLRSVRGRGAELGVVPPIDEVGLRELAAIFRSDLALVISSREWELLSRAWGIPESQLMLCRVLHPVAAAEAMPASKEELPGSGQPRSGFAWIGNFRHPPNLDSIRWLQSEIWPKIRARLPGAEVNVYGAYPPREIMALDDAAAGFRVRGPAPCAAAALARHRVNLAPLRFGAGIKGKIVDGWRVGLPVVTTPVGAEGLGEHQVRWGGIVGETVDALVEGAVRLHENEDLRLEHAREGFRLASALFDPAREGSALLTRVQGLRADLDQARERNLFGRILRFQTNRGTEYFSRWIEAKNRLNDGYREGGSVATGARLT